MEFIKLACRRVKALFTRNAIERDIDDEMRLHMDLLAEEFQRSGMPLDQAKHAARRRFGNLSAIKENARDIRGAGIAGDLLQDVRYALRSLRHSASFTTAAVLTIALGIGINTGIFSILNSIALRSLPAPAASQLVSIYQNFRGVSKRSVHGAGSLFSTSEYESYRDRTQSLTGVMSYSMPSDVTLGGDMPRQTAAVFVSCNYFDVLQLKPTLGLGFTRANCNGANATPVVVLSRDLWKDQFGADPNAIGKNILLNRKSFTVVGVASEGFYGTEIFKSSLFLPISTQPDVLPGLDMYHAERLSWLTMIGRRKDGVSVDQVRADLRIISRQIDQLEPGRTTDIITTRATSVALPEGRQILFSLSTVVLAAFGLVLLIASANVANLVLARAMGRSKEIAVRLSLGATRARLIQQLLTESILIALAGGVLGSALALWSFRGLLTVVLSSLPGDVPPVAIDSSPDLRVLLFAVAVTVAAGIFFGLAPALHASKADLQSTLKQDSGGGGRRTVGLLRGGLVGLQVAVCMVLMIAAGLLLRGLYAAQTVDPGFSYQNVAVVSFDLTSAGYTDDKADLFQRELMDRAKALPGVDSVAQVGRTPLSPGRSGTMFRLPGEERMHPVDFNSVSPEYFSLVRIPIVRGRTFVEEELRGQPRAVIVTEATARRYWVGRDPIGQTLTMGLGPKHETPMEVVGVAKDTQITQIADIPSSYMYVPTNTRAMGLNVLVRGGAGFLKTASVLRTIAHDLDPGLVVRINRLEDNLEFWRTMSRLATSLSAGLCALALAIAAIGVYGVVSYVVSRRLREMSIRIVLGATNQAVRKMIVKQAMRPVAVGVFVGIACAAAVSRILEVVLFGISAFDPLAFLAAPLLLLAIAVAASLVPARRALRADPLAILRYE